MTQMHDFWKGAPTRKVTVRPVVKTGPKVYAVKVRRIKKGGEASSK